MKHFKLVFLFVAFALMLSSCKKRATLEVINKKNCNYNFFDGGSGGEYLGQVNANATKTFEIDLPKGLFSNLVYANRSFYAEPLNCPSSSSESFYVDLEKKKTSTILID